MSGLEITKEGLSVRIAIKGKIDENFKFPDDLNCDVVVVDFGGLTILNSIGIRSWLVWTAGRKGFKRMQLEKCPTIFIDQASHIRGLIPEYASVESFYAPFYDESAAAQVDTLLVRGKDFDEQNFTLPKVFNAQGEPLALDVPESYFSFLKANK